MRLPIGWLSGAVSSAILSACAPAPTPRVSNPQSNVSALPAATAKAEHDVARSQPAPAAHDLSEKVPTDCFKPGPVCSPEPSFVKRLCNGKFPSVGLYLFANPRWSRGYATRRTQAWNASGGASDSGWVEFDEEVLILYARVADAGGMQVSGASGSYDVLRWDGSCVTLQSEELTTAKAPSPKYPAIDFRYLDDETQQALRRDAAVNKAWQDRRKECKGATSGDVSLQCVKADDKLTKTLIAFVRAGGAVPEPKQLP